jgi:hypothetical protein
MHHFMSNSPWSGPLLINKVQEEVAQQDEFQKGSVLFLDESADDKTGRHSVGVGRQYNGRRGKVDNCQVGVFLSYANNGYHTWTERAAPNICHGNWSELMNNKYPILRKMIETISVATAAIKFRQEFEVPSARRLGVFFSWL